MQIGDLGEIDPRTDPSRMTRKKVIKHKDILDRIMSHLSIKRFKKYKCAV